VREKERLISRIIDIDERSLPKKKIYIKEKKIVGDDHNKMWAAFNERRVIEQCE
jgi:hypothetical protein